MTNKHSSVLAAFAALHIFAATLVLADDKTAAAPNADADKLEEVVVTAERTPSTVQRTPIAMTVLGGEQLEREGVYNTIDLNGKVPNVNISNNNGTATVVIRGVGTNYDSQSAEPAVNVNVDGVYINRAGAAIGALFDVQRLEVLRGPQGTLYGRNSTGGSFNIITNKPVQDYEGQAEVEMGNYNLVHTVGMLNVPLNDALAFRVAFQSERHDGYTNDAPAVDYNDADSVALRAHLLYKPSDVWSLLLSADYGHYGGVGSDHLTIPEAAHSFTIPLDVNGRQDTPIYGTSAELNYLLDSTTLTFISSYRYFHRRQLYDADYTYVPIAPGQTPYYATFNWSNHNVTEELRWTSDPASRLKWVAGAFYYQEQNHYLFESFASSPTTVSTCFCDPDTGAKSYAGFGQATYNLTDTFAITGGVRYTEDKKYENGQTIIVHTAGAPTVVTNFANLSFDNTSGKVGLEWNVAPASMLYVSVSDAYKAGGYFDGLNNVYLPEKLTSYEIGAKNRFLDDRLQVNLAAFYYDYRDFQATYVVTLAGGARVAATGNAAKARSEGVEAEVTYLLTSADRIDLNATYLDAKFEDFILNSVPAQNYSGLTMPRSPRATATLGYTHTWKFVDGSSLNAHVQSHYETSSWLLFQHFNGSLQPSYTRTDLDVSYESGRHWYASLFGENLENKPIAGDAVAGVGNVPALDLLPPRTYGIRVGARF